MTIRQLLIRLFVRAANWLIGQKASRAECLLLMGDLSPEAFTPRSSAWGSIRDLFVKENPSCAVCGRRNDVEVHHVLPVHLYPDWELVWSNLVTLCPRCHLFVGHLGNYQSYNPRCLDDVKAWRKKFANRP